VPAVDGDAPAAPMGVLKLTQGDVERHAGALQDADRVREGLQDGIPGPLCRGKAARRVERALRVEVLSEQWAGAELVAKLEAGDEFAPQHGAAAVQLQPAVPASEDATGGREIDALPFDDDPRPRRAALDQRRPQELCGQAAVVERDLRQLLEGELSV